MILESILDNKHPHATFHDSILYNINVDYKDRSAKFRMDMFVGDPSERIPERRAMYAEGVLEFSDLFFCVIEPPDPNYNFIETEGLWIDEGSISDLKGQHLPSDLLKKIPEGAIARYFL
jgi:hypothetical protein